MKGGITSGVVYPWAAVELSESYRFRSVGGTSAGAIAAGAVAAAEFGRRPGSNGEAFAGVAGLPSRLGGELLSLFQPAFVMRPLFNTLIAGLGKGLIGRFLSPLVGFPIAAALGFFGGACAFAAALVGADEGRFVLILAGALLTLVGPFVAVLASAALRLCRLPRHYFGICRGNDRGESARRPPLTRWLADLFDELAGKDPSDPLTFGDLATPDPVDGLPSINLKVITTNLSQGRPYTLPFAADEDFWFSPDEFLDLFPARIVDRMVNSAPSEVRTIGNKTIRRLPAPGDIPVVVAVRMSLSFPLLISAVPLYAFNDAPAEPGLERCWFSDGGITSNFPIHFFDAPVPKWPTFGIDLMPLAKGREIEPGDEANNIWMPSDNAEGILEAWVGWDAGPPWKRVAAFGGSIFRTAQTWMDTRQKRGAGFRDRIVQIRLAGHEGGINLNMKAEDIERLAERGRCAGEELKRRFEPDAPTARTGPLNWDNQRWMRFRSYMALVEREGLLARRGTRIDPGGASSAENIRAPADGDLSAHGWATEEQRAFATAAANALLKEFELWEQRCKEDKATFVDGEPEPRRAAWSMPEI